MGFKSVELQVAIPRSQDAGKMQEQMMRQGQHFQETLTKQQLKEEIINRGKVNEYENVRDRNEEEERNQRKQERQQSKKKSDKEFKQEDHPYLGRQIDFSG